MGATDGAEHASLVIAVAAAIIAAVIALAGATILFLLRGQRRTQDMLEQDIAEALEKSAAVPLDRAAGEVRKAVELAKDLYLENETLREQLAKARPARPDRKGERRFVEAVVVCLDEAIRAIHVLADDPEFTDLARVLALPDGLRRAQKALESLPDEQGFADRLLAVLSDGDLNAALTTSDIFEGYFQDRRHWRPVRRLLRTAQDLLVHLLERHEVEMIGLPILSIAGRGELQSEALVDRRNLRSIEAIRRAASRKARTLQPAQYLVVDCYRPGWRARGLPPRAPALAVFDSASWT